MVEMGVGQQDIVNAGRLEGERFLVLFLQLTAALI
jgi:hypothetical protein